MIKGLKTFLGIIGFLLLILILSFFMFSSANNDLNSLDNRVTINSEEELLKTIQDIDNRKLTVLGFNNNKFLKFGKDLPLESEEVYVDYVVTISNPQEEDGIKNDSLLWLNTAVNDKNSFPVKPFKDVDNFKLTKVKDKYGIDKFYITLNITKGGKYGYGYNLHFEVDGKDEGVFKLEPKKGIRYSVNGKDTVSKIRIKYPKKFLESFVKEFNEDKDNKKEDIKLEYYPAISIGKVKDK